MEDGLRHGQRVFTHLDPQEQFAFGIDGCPHPVGGTREALNRLGFTHVTVSDRTEHGVQFVKMDLIEGQLVQKVGRKGV